jgi:hypothetical protein
VSHTFLEWKKISMNISENTFVRVLLCFYKTFFFITCNNPGIFFNIQSKHCQLQKILHIMLTRMHHQSGYKGQTKTSINRSLKGVSQILKLAIMNGKLIFLEIGQIG